MNSEKDVVFWLQCLIDFSSFFDHVASLGAKSDPKSDVFFDFMFASIFDPLLIRFGSLLGAVLGTVSASFRHLGGSGGHPGTTLILNEVPRPSEDLK